jgi:hypothetical protein
MNPKISTVELSGMDPLAGQEECGFVDLVDSLFS